MAAVITANATAATASQVRLRLSVSVVNARGTATASVAAADVDYIELALGARLDTTGKFKFISEIVLMLDALRINTSKRLADNFALTESTSRTSQKLLADTALSADQITARNTVKALADATGVPDRVAATVSKVLADAFALGDARAITAGKTLADTFGLTDAQTANLQKKIADSVSFTETFYTVLVFIRTVEDTVAVSDLPAKRVAKAPFLESITADDQSTRFLQKLISDGVAMNDGTTVGDGSTFYIEKNVNNIATVSDQSSRQAQKAATDSVGLSDFGVLSIQGYCDITYFAEDYVGTSRNF